MAILHKHTITMLLSIHVYVYGTSSNNNALENKYLKQSKYILSNILKVLFDTRIQSLHIKHS